MKNKLPTVSIGMPVYNGEKYIRESLNSLLRQDYTDFELIISDNASTDNTEQICLEYVTQDIRVKYYRNQYNLGAMPNFERVLSLSKGKYFMWAAHDDSWESNFISTLINHLISNENIVLAMVETQYKSLDNIHLPFFAEGKGFYQLQENESQLESLLKVVKYNYGNLVYGLYKKEALFKGTGSSIISDIKYSNENPIFIHVASRGSIIVESRILFYKRVPVSIYLYAAREYKFFPVLDNIIPHQINNIHNEIKNSKSISIKSGLRTVKNFLRIVKRFFVETTNIFVYHWKTWLDIKISVLDIDAKLFTKLIILSAFLIRLIKHFFKMTFTWKIINLFNKKALHNKV